MILNWNGNFCSGKKIKWRITKEQTFYRIIISLKYEMRKIESKASRMNKNGKVFIFQRVKRGGECKKWEHVTSNHVNKEFFCRSQLCLFMSSSEYVSVLFCFHHLLKAYKHPEMFYYFRNNSSLFITHLLQQHLTTSQSKLHWKLHFKSIADVCYLGC